MIALNFPERKSVFVCLVFSWRPVRSRHAFVALLGRSGLLMFATVVLMHIRTVMDPILFFHRFLPLFFVVVVVVFERTCLSSACHLLYCLLFLFIFYLFYFGLFSFCFLICVLIYLFFLQFLHLAFFVYCVFGYFFGLFVLELRELPGL